MAKDINTNSKEWCDIVFEGKNKSYGAYQMRVTSTKRHIGAFITVLFLLFIFVLLPYLVEQIAFYRFQHSRDEYVQEDYKYITETLTEAELMQMTKQFIPSQKNVELKPKKSRMPAPNVDAQPPVIVTDSLLVQADTEVEADTSATTREQIDQEETAENQEQTDDGLYTLVEQMPCFQGGEAGLMQFIYKNLHYPASAGNKKIENLVICSFIIDINGKVIDPQIVQSAEPAFDREALRLVRSLPRWKPGKHHGKPIRVKYTLPIVFSLK